MLTLIPWHSCLGLEVRGHYALGHMRRWDGAYPPLANGTKAVDLMKTEEGKARSVLFHRQCGFYHEHNVEHAQVCAAHEEGPCVRVLAFPVLLRGLRGTAADSQEKFLLETDAAIDELLSFQVEV